jgi:hypothetical protein
VYRELQLEAKDFQLANHEEIVTDKFSTTTSTDPVLQNVNQSKELFRVFPMTFRLTLLLYEDWLISIGDLISIVPRGDDLIKFNIVFELMRGIRASRISWDGAPLTMKSEPMEFSIMDVSADVTVNNYLPPLVRYFCSEEADAMDRFETELTKVAERLVSYCKVKRKKGKMTRLYF